MNKFTITLGFTEYFTLKFGKYKGQTYNIQITMRDGS